MKTVCFFGIFDPEYARNRVLVRGFEENGYEVYLCRVDPKKERGVSKFFALVREFKKMPQKKFDHVIVAFPGHSVVWLARLLFGRKIIFDMFVSLYNSEIEDRKTAPSLSLKALYFWFLDRISLGLSSRILIDTAAHRDLVLRRFSVRRDAFLVVPVGSDDSVVHPVDTHPEGNKIVVHFHGTGSPLQGIGYIRDAARMLESNTTIEFHLYGIAGENTSNVRYLPVFPYRDMSSVLGRADIVLGIFGTTEKAKSVIPNKVYEGLAAKKPVLTMGSPAIAELLVDGLNVVLCKSGSAEDVAQKVTLLANDTEMRQRIASAGFVLFKEMCTPAIIVKNLLRDI